MTSKELENVREALDWLRDNPSHPTSDQYRHKLYGWCRELLAHIDEQQAKEESESEYLKIKGFVSVEDAADIAETQRVLCVATKHKFEKSQNYNEELVFLYKRLAEQAWIIRNRIRALTGGDENGQRT